MKGKKPDQTAAHTKGFTCNGLFQTKSKYQQEFLCGVIKILKL